MEKEEVVIGSPVEVAGVTLVPLVKVSLNYWSRKGSISALGVKQPINILVVSVSAKKAFSMTGEEVPIDQLTQEVPGIEEVLERI